MPHGRPTAISWRSSTAPVDRRGSATGSRAMNRALFTYPRAWSTRAVVQILPTLGFPCSSVALNGATVASFYHSRGCPVFGRIPVRWANDCRPGSVFALG